MRKIKRAYITTIALCQRPKNGLRTVLKSDGQFELATLSKASAKDELLAVVYAPDRVDSDEEFTTADVIKAMAHEYVRDHRQLDIEHDGEILTNDQAFLAESFIIAKGDERFSNWKDHEDKEVGDLTGAWGVVIKIVDSTLQKALVDGLLDGVSMFGKAALEPLQTKAASKRVADRLGAAKNKPTEEDQMDETKLKALFAELTQSLVKALEPVTALVKANTEKPAKKGAELEAPVFKGDPTKDKDLEAFERELVGYELRKGMAEGTLTAADIRDMRAKLAETAPSDEEAGVKKGDSAEVRELKKSLFKAQKKSNAPEGGKAGEGSDDDPEEIRKANISEGRKIADEIAERRGMKIVRTTKTA